MNVTNKIDILLQNSMQETNKLLFYGFCMLILIVIIQLFTILWEPKIWHAWFSFVIYLCFCVLSYKKAPIFFYLFFLFYFGQGTAIVSGAYLESGNYISEQATYAYATGATSRLVLYNLIFFLIGLLFFIYLFKRIPQNIVNFGTYSKKSVLAISISISFMLIILYSGLYIYGIPLFEGLDRYAYWINHPMPIFRTLSGQIFFSAFLLGLMYSVTKRRIFLLLLLVASVYLILQSIKFSALVMVGYLFLLPIIITNVTYRKFKFSFKKVLLYSTIALSILISVIYYHYSTIHFSSESSMIGSITNRVLGLQGHVWWGTDTEVKARNSAINFDQISKEFSSFISLSSEKEEVGMKHLICLVAPPHIANAFLEKGVNFTMGYPAIGLQLFGYIGLLFLQVIVALIVVASTIYVYHKVICYQLIRGAVAIKLFIEIYGAFTIGNFYQLFSTKVIFYLFLIILFESIAYLGKRRKINQKLPILSQ